MANYNYDFWSKENEFAPGSAKSQRMIGGAIDRSLAERRLMADRAEARKDRQLKRDILNYSYAQKLAQDMDSYNIMPTSGVQGMDEVMTNLGRSIADQAAYYNSELNRTQDHGAYANAMARLNSDVKEAKNFDNKIKQLLGTYGPAMENGTLSDYVDAKTRGIIEDLRSGSPEGEFKNVNGVTTWVGKDPFTKESYNLAVGEVDQLINRLQLKENVNDILDKSVNIQTTKDGNILAFDQPAFGQNNQKGLSAADFANDALVDVLDSVGAQNKERKSIALLVDNFGYDKNKVSKLFAEAIPDEERTQQEIDDGIITRGDQLLQKEWMNKARNRYTINQAAVQKYNNTADDQRQKHFNAKDIQRQLRTDRANTEDALANDNDARFWNTEINTNLTNLKGLDPKVALTRFNGLMEKFKGDLALLGLTNTEIKLGDGTVVPAKEFTDEEGNTIKQEGYLAAGPPVSMVIQNPKVPGAPAIEVPFNATKADIKRAIRQAQGMQQIGMGITSNYKGYNLN